MSISHKSYDSLCYFMLFPNGTYGCLPELRFDAGERQKKLIPSMFYSWACFREGLNSERFFQAVGSSGSIWWITCAKWKPKGRATCSIISRASVIRTTQFFENCSETREAQMMSRRQSGPVAWLCFLLLTFAASGTCARRCMTLLRLRRRRVILPYS